MDGWTAQCSLAAAECRCGREEGTGRGERGGGGIIAAFRRGAGAEPARSSLRAMIPFTLSERGIQDGVGRRAGGRK